MTTDYVNKIFDAALNGKKHKKLYDPKCYELACYFLEGTPKDNERERDDLADTIQRTIEDSLENVPLD